jgi:hypothetical protein
VTSRILVSLRVAATPERALAGVIACGSCFMTASSQATSYLKVVQGSRSAALTACQIMAARIATAVRFKNINADISILLLPSQLTIVARVVTDAQSFGLLGTP